MYTEIRKADNKDRKNVSENVEKNSSRLERKFLFEYLISHIPKLFYYSSNNGEGI